MNSAGPKPRGDTRKRDVFLQVAVSIADALVARAIQQDGRYGWLGYDMVQVNGDWRPAYRSLDESLYGGLAGVALFLSDLWAYRPDPAYAAAATGAIREANRLLRERRGVSTHGWYGGLTGNLWCARQVARRFDALDLCADADLLAEVTAAPPPAGDIFDLVSGASGTLLGLLALTGGRPAGEVLAACHDLAEWLLDRARHGPGTGLSWAEPASGTEAAAPLCGLAHGASSPGLALLEFWAICGDPRYRAAAFAAFRYERQWFDRRQGSWPDLRDLPASGAPPCPAYWCYGAGGIGLARLRAWELTGDRVMLAEFGAAKFTCYEKARAALADNLPPEDFDMNASLCHGLGSILEVLLYAARLTDDRAALRLARALGAAMRTETTGEWRCGVIDAGETPGLMPGLAGIGSAMLGLHDPAAYRPRGLVVTGEGPKH